MNKIFRMTFFILAGLAAASVLVFIVRQSIANREIEREWEVVPTIIPELQSTTRLEIVPVYEEASADNDFIIGHGVSYLIRTDLGAILMDIGDNPDDLTVAPYMHNMEKLGISWDEIDRVVISHPHSDHVGGVDAWKDSTVSFGELPAGGVGDRLLFIPTKMNLPGSIHATIPTLPLPDVATTGVISYLEVFPLSLFEPKGSEQALAVYVENKGLVLITGCGHPKIERLVERAEELYDIPVVGVVGGFHYEGFTAEDVQPHIQFLQAQGVRLVAMSPHDSSPEALEAYRLAFSESYQDVAVGRPIQFP